MWFGVWVGIWWVGGLFCVGVFSVRIGFERLGGVLFGVLRYIVLCGGGVLLGVGLVL